MLRTCVLTVFTEADSSLAISGRDRVRQRVNHRDPVMTAHPSGGEARFVAKGSHGQEGASGNTRRSEPPANPAQFT